MLGSLFKKVTGLQACSFTKKGLKHRCFPVNIANFKSLRLFRKNICERLLLIVVIYCIENWIKLCRNQTGILFFLKHKTTLFYLFSFVLIRFITRSYSLSFIFIFCYSLSFVVLLVVTCCHSLYYSLWFVVIRCHLLYHSLSFVVTRCHSLSLVVIRCHSIYHSSVFLKTIALYISIGCCTKFNNYYVISILSY